MLIGIYGQSLLILGLVIFNTIILRNQQNGFIKKIKGL